MANKRINRQTKNISIYQDPIASISKEMEHYTLDNLDPEDFLTSPEKWDNRKILFYFYRTMNKIYWDKVSYPGDYFKHNRLIHLLTPMGVSAITLTHTFAPTFLGYTQEAFSWKLEIKNSNMLDNINDIYVSSKSNINLQIKNNELIFDPNKFYEKSLRLTSIANQEVNILRLFRELYSSLKGANDNLVNMSKETLLLTVLNLICFAVHDFEELSLNRQEHSESQDKVIISNIKKIYSIKIKVSAIYQKPYIKIKVPYDEFNY